MYRWWIWKSFFSRHLRCWLLATIVKTMYWNELSLFDETDFSHIVDSLHIFGIMWSSQSHLSILKLMAKWTNDCPIKLTNVRTNEWMTWLFLLAQWIYKMVLLNSFSKMVYILMLCAIFVHDGDENLFRLASNRHAVPLMCFYFSENFYAHVQPISFYTFLAD